MGEGRRRWQDAIEAVFATTAEQVIAVDSKGAVLRVVQRADIDDAPEQDEAQDLEGVTNTQKELAQVSQIIADAYSTAHDHAREASSRGYELLAKFAELSFGRLAAIEKAYGQLLAAHARAMESDAKESDGLDSAIAGVVSKAMGGSLSAPGNGKKE